ncbi:MAG: type II toxin-antitoxin system PemK/MazF family toxin [Acidimicrobiia bacterium]|nr:type II toxin-antitoxin system PemK/MazF family toxin [Acidimicrobiia bacterium]
MRSGGRGPLTPHFESGKLKIQRPGVASTTTRRDLSFHIEVEATPETGLAETSYVQCELVRSVNRDRLVHRLGMIDIEGSRRVTDVLRMLLGH